MQLPKKTKKTLRCNFIPFLESILNFEQFEKKNEPHSLTISEIVNSEKCGYLIA